MDRGAARSRKRAIKAERIDEAVESKAVSAGAAGKSHTKKGKGKGKGRDGERANKDDSKDNKSGDADKIHPERKKRKGENNDPSMFRPKAIRDSAALIYSAEAFDLPPSLERLQSVTRVDLEGSGCTDISWLAGTKVTWLNLKGCAISKGWEAVAGLSDLAVLNLSACELKKLPACLESLHKLKAFVAMNNEWTEMDNDVVAGWKELNSMIVSHSPNLSSLPASLAQLPHLSKLTFSHCPSLSAASLPDLSALPVLRDVGANNLPRLTALPSHISTWGTGDLSLAGKAGTSTSPKLGEGLDALDLGNCSLPFSAVSATFGLAPGSKLKGPPRWANLRRLTLRANPLALEQPSYVQLLQDSGEVPKLQIVDSKRLVERKRAGVAPETKGDRKARERREGKMRPTGANEQKGTTMRAWGAQAEGDDGAAGKKDKKRKAEDSEESEKKSRKKQKETVSAVTEGKTSKPRVSEASGEKYTKRKDRDDEQAKHKQAKVVEPAAAEPRKPKKPKQESSAPPAAAIPATSTPADPAAASRAKPSRTQTAVVGVVDVRDKPKGKGLDLASVFKKKDEDNNSGSGLGVGGW